MSSNRLSNGIRMELVRQSNPKPIQVSKLGLVHDSAAASLPDLDDV